MYDCRSPLNEALRAITGKLPPFDLMGVYTSSELSDEIARKLESWCSINAAPAWATGSGVLEAAELLVDRELENRNIPPRRNIDG